MTQNISDLYQICEICFTVMTSSLHYTHLLENEFILSHTDTISSNTWGIMVVGTVEKVTNYFHTALPYCMFFHCFVASRNQTAFII